MIRKTLRSSASVRRHWRLALGFCLGAAALPAMPAALPASPPVDAAAASTPTLQQVQKKLAGLAIPFEANQGQFAPDVAFAARTFAGTLFVTHDGHIVHAISGKPEQAQAAASEPSARKQAAAPRGPGWALVESLQGASELAPAGSQPSATRISRFVGSDAAKWQSDIATFERVRLGQAWPGVAVELAARGSNVEKLFTVAPGTDPQVIRMRVTGADALRLGADGSLIAATGNGDIAFTPPVAFQDIAGVRTEVPVSYVLLADNGYAFSTGA